MDSQVGRAEYASEPAAGWPAWLPDRLGAILRDLAHPGRSAQVAVRAAVRDLAELPGVTDARLAAPGTDRTAHLQLPAGPGRELVVSGPAARRPELAQAARLVACAIEGRLAGAATAGRRALLSVDLHAMVDSVHLAILVVDEQLRVAEASAAALAVMGLLREGSGVTGVPLAELAERADPAAREVVQIAVDFAQRSIGGGDPVRREEIRLPDGMLVEASYLPVDLDGGGRGHLLVGQDISNLVATRQVIDARNRELVRLGTLKNEFLATVSHELRTPLTATSSLVELLGAGDADEATRAEVVAALRRNTGRLTVLVEDLLVLARLESGQLALAVEPVDTRRLVSACVAAARQEEGAPELTVTGVVADDGGPTEVAGDPYWLDRMVRHVLSGAVATSAAGSKVAVHSQVRDGRWTLAVTGWDLLTRYTTHRRTANAADAAPPPALAGNQACVGLGLTLANAIARRHGGDLQVNPADGGAVIRISLPTS